MHADCIFQIKRLVIKLHVHVRCHFSVFISVIPFLYVCDKIQGHNTTQNGIKSLIGSGSASS